MTPLVLSRRTFLQAAGALAAGLSLPAPLASLILPAGALPPLLPSPAYARVTMPVHLRATPHFAAALVQVLPLRFDTLVAYRENCGNGWMQVTIMDDDLDQADTVGYIHCVYLQPIGALPIYSVRTAFNDLNANDPLWAWVGAASAVVREWASPDAPARHHMSWGETARVIDRLDGWLHIGDGNATPIGWTPLTRWQPFAPHALASSEQIDRLRCADDQLTLFSGDRAMLQTPIEKMASSIAAGRYPLIERTPLIAMGDRLASYALTFADDDRQVVINGSIGNGIRLTIPAAALVYTNIAPNALLEID